MLCSQHVLLSSGANAAVHQPGPCLQAVAAQQPGPSVLHRMTMRSCRSSSCSSATTGSGSTRSLSSMAAAGAPPTATRALQTPGASAAVDEQDVRFATLLSELVYRAAECIDEAAFRNAQATVEHELGARLAHVRRHKSGGQRFLVGETDAAIYVAFQGTKSAGDWLANLNFFHGHFGGAHGKRQDDGQQQVQSPPAGAADVRASSSSLHSSISSASLASSAAASMSSSSDSDLSSSPSSSSRSRAARAHIGFLRRANSAAVSISALHAAAAAAGKRLVLTGHSLGGAVAVLTTVRLLRAITSGGGSDGSSSSGLTPSLLNGDDEPLIRCISFATPAVANSELLAEVTAAGWDHFITNIVMPEDPVVPFVNLLLKAPPSPSKPRAGPHRLFRAGEAPGSPASSSACSSSSSSYGAASIYSSPSSPVLTRCSSDGGSQLLALDVGGPSWDLQLDALDLSGMLTTTSLAATEQQPRNAAAAAGPWGVPLQLPDLAYTHALSGSSQALLELALGADVVAAGAGCGPGSPRMGVVAAAAAVSAAGSGGSSSNSPDLASWLAAAEGAARAATGGPGEASPPSSARSFGQSGRNSASGNSLYSLQLDLSCLDDPTCSEAGSSGRSSPISPGSRSRSEPGFMSTAAADAAALPGQAAGGSGQEQPDCAQQQQALDGTGGRLPLVKRLQQQLTSGRATRWAWISGAVAASLRCASAFAAVPGMVATPHLSLLTLLPRALVGPAALAVLHFVGHAAYKAAMPASHPLGQQFVMTGSGLELVAKPLTAYPRDAEALGLKELGGFCPGHRMIAYRRRLAALVSQQQSP